MKYLNLITTLLCIIQWSTTPELKNELNLSNTVKVSIDWRNPVNRIHTEAHQLQKLSKRKITKLYLLNKNAEQEFKLRGIVHTEGKTRRTDADRNTLVFNISTNGVMVQEALYIYVMPNQKLIPHQSDKSN